MIYILKKQFYCLDPSDLWAWIYLLTIHVFYEEKFFQKNPRLVEDL